jgi:beta-galactosidase GanA
MLKISLKRVYILIFLILFSAFSFSQKPAKDIADTTKITRFIGEKKLYFGAAYYPEVWAKSEIEKDIVRMKKLKMNVMRMGEFSWSKMEPAEGKYDFGWLHKIIDKLHANGIDVILGTPTATPPVWLAEKQPEMFQLNEQGIRMTHGGRRNCSYTSKVYRQYSKKICTKMAQEFGNRPGVIAWQTDNEFSLSADYSAETKKQWESWLKKRYNTIENLNQLWCTDLWSQTYQKFEQIQMPTSAVWNHPSLRFAWAAFTNDMIVEYQDIQLTAIRKYSKLPITHDGMPQQQVDYEKLFKNLDFAATNNYHSFEAYDLIQSNYDRLRGQAKGYHWLFETAPNYSGGGEKGQTWYLHQIPGSMKAALWMNYASGGQGAMFWLWRQHRAGQEMVHGSVLSAFGGEVSNYPEIKELGSELDKSSEFLMDNPVAKAEAAVLYSHESETGFKFEEYASGINYYLDWTYRFYRAMADVYIFRDVIYPSADLKQYKLIFIPLMPVISDEFQQRLKAWVEQGGTLVLGPQSGYRTEEWAQHTNHFLGKIEDWSGVEVKTIIPIGAKRRAEEMPFMLDFDAKLYIPQSEASLWSLALWSKNGNVLATYKGGAHDKKLAIIENSVGKGRVILLGTDPGKPALKNLLLYAADKSNVKPLATGDEQVVIVPRKGKQSGWVMVNLSKNAKKIVLNTDAKAFENILLDTKISSNEFELKPYEVLVLKNF